MNINYRRSIIIFLVLVIVFISTFGQLQAFSFSANPISLLQKTTNIVLGRVSDIVYYLMMQKKYIFEKYTDPNVYPSLDIPPVVENIIASSTIKIVPPKETDSNKVVSVTTSTLPTVKKTIPVAVNIQNQNNFPAPVVIKATTVSSPKTIPSSNYVGDSQILKYTNDERENLSLKPLLANSILDTIAKQRADDLFAFQYFEHSSPDGKTASELAKKNKYDYLLIGENLALGDFGGDKGIVSAWMNSPGHRANIINEKYTELGVAKRTGEFKGEIVTIAVQIFAAPLSNCNRPNSNTKELIDTSSLSIKEMQDKAAIMYRDLNEMAQTPGVDRSYYSQKISEYNYYAKKVNDAIVALKVMIDSYNIAVSKYNNCIGS
jgi:uncharacterized protein YkwD